MSEPKLVGSLQERLKTIPITGLEAYRNQLQKMLLTNISESYRRKVEEAIQNVTIEIEERQDGE